MKTYVAFLLGFAFFATSCSRKTESAAALTPAGYGAAIVESSGSKQFAQTGSLLPQPVVVQVNDAQGTGVAGALVEFAAAPGVTFDPPNGLTDSSGQVTTNVSLGGMAGRYQITASTPRQVAQESRTQARRDCSGLSTNFRWASERSVL